MSIVHTCSEKAPIVESSVKVCVLENICTVEDFYQNIKTGLDLPDYFGHNLDALYDCLSTDVKGPVEIHWFDYADAVAHLGTEQAEQFLAVLDDVAVAREDFVVLLSAKQLDNEIM